MEITLIFPFAITCWKTGWQDVFNIIQVQNKGINLILIFCTAFYHHHVGAYALGLVAALSRLLQAQRSLLASFHAATRPAPSTSLQYLSTFLSHEFCGRPLSPLHSLLSDT